MDLFVKDATAFDEDVSKFAEESSEIKEHVDQLAQFRHQGRGEFRGIIHRLALGQVDQDRGDFIIMALQVQTGDQVGAVFLGRQGRGFLVGGIFRQSINAAAANPPVGNRIRVD